MTPRSSDDDLLDRLIRGEVAASEAELLAERYARDRRVAERGEVLAHSADPFLHALRQPHVHPNPEVDGLADRLVQRLRTATHKQDPKGQTPPASSAHHPESLEWFRVVRLLGEGGMGAVYLAEDTRLGRLVALKTLKPELAAEPGFKERFLREARTVAQLDHQHIVPIYYVGEAQGLPFLAMPLLQGETLTARLQRSLIQGQSLPIPEVVDLARQIATGLAHAHARGLMHRDIKPANIWLESPGGHVKILDFGLARSCRENPEALTGSGVVMGTPAYMAPEQAAAELVDSRVDLFSLGCILYELLTGQRPFRAVGDTSLPTSQAGASPPSPSTLNPFCPPGLARLTLQLLARDPNQRPQSAEVVVAELTQWAAAPATASMVRQQLSARSWYRRKAMLAVAAGFVSVPLAVWLANLILRGETPGSARPAGLSAAPTGPSVTGPPTAATPSVRGEEPFRAWLQEIARLPPSKQAAAVARKLQDLNPGFHGKFKSSAEGDVVTEFEVHNVDSLVDISPLRALPALTKLRLTAINKSDLCDLEPLRGLKLRTFRISGTSVADLDPLRNMPLEQLFCDATLVRDVTPLQGMPLQTLVLYKSAVRDLTPLRGMPIQDLNFGGTAVSDLTPLEGMPLMGLFMGHTQVSDLAPLQGMSLKRLTIDGTKVKDLTTLKGMPLVMINYRNAPVADVSPLNGMPLEDVECTYHAERDAAFLRSLPKLCFINRKPVAEFWKEVNAVEPAKHP